MTEYLSSSVSHGCQDLEDSLLVPMKVQTYPYRIGMRKPFSTFHICVAYTLGV